MSKLRITLILIIGLLVMFIDGAALALYGKTVVEWSLPLAVGLFVAALTLRPMLGLWKRLFDDPSPWLAGVAHMVAMTGVAAFIFLGANIMLADAGEVREERVELVGREREQHYHQRRVGRGRYVRGSAYYEYYMTVRLPDGREKRLRITLAHYNRLARRDSVTLNLLPGAFGLPVMVDR